MVTYNLIYQFMAYFNNNLGINSDERCKSILVHRIEKVCLSSKFQKKQFNSKNYILMEAKAIKFIAQMT